MKNVKSLFDKSLAVLVVLAILVFSGCEEAAKTDSGVQITLRPVFYPPPPEQARLQFLRAISGEDDITEKVESSGFETFILGEEEEKTDDIEKPHGIAVYEQKLYVCDVGKRMVVVLDLEAGTFGFMTKDRRLRNPANIYIESDGTKYVSDAVAQAVFVFDKYDQITGILGSGLGIKPVDVAVQGQRCYVADAASNKVVVMDIATGNEVTRIGDNGQFKAIAGLTLDEQGNVYVSDKIRGNVTKFDPSGAVVLTVGELSDSIHGLVRPKGLAVDKAGNIWIVDAATEVAKIYDSQGRLLLFFGMPGGDRGNMILPGEIWLDYNNIEAFQDYLAEGADVEFLVLISNQFGAKVNIYGFGSFPVFKPTPPEERDEVNLKPQQEDLK